MSVGTTNSCELLGSPLVTQIAVTAHTQGHALFSGGIKRLATGRMCFTTQSYAHPLEVENHESCCITQCFGTGTIISMRFDCYHREWTSWNKNVQNNCESNKWLYRIECSNQDNDLSKGNEFIATINIVSSRVSLPLQTNGTWNLIIAITHQDLVKKENETNAYSMMMNSEEEFGINHQSMYVIDLILI